MEQPNNPQLQPPQPPEPIQNPPQPPQLVVPQAEPAAVPPQPQFQPQLAPQPQPAFAPQPQPAFAPQPMASPAPMVQAGQGKPKIGLLIGVIVGVAVLIAAAIAGFILLSGPTKDDYKKSAATASDVVATYNGMSATYISTSATETEIKNDLDTLKANRSKFDTQFAELATQKAISRDDEINKLYKAATDKKVKFDNAQNAQIEAYEKILPLVIKIDSTPSDASAYASMISTLRGDLQALQLNEQVNKDYIASLVRDLKKVEALIPTIVAGKEDYRKYDSKATSDFYDTIDSLSNDDRDWKSNMDKLQSNGELRDDLNKLEDALFAKTVK